MSSHSCPWRFGRRDRGASFASLRAGLGAPVNFCAGGRFRFNSFSHAGGIQVFGGRRLQNFLPVRLPARTCLILSREGFGIIRRAF